MKVKKLIQLLSKMPREAEFGYAWDGEVRSEVGFVWLARNGEVVLADNGPIYSTNGRPANAPSEKDVKYWTPEEIK